MRNRYLLIPLAVLLLVWSGACEKLSEPAVEDLSTFTATLESIPAEYGDLEAVTAMPEYPGWFQLWFEDPAGTIRYVRVHPGDNLIHTDIVVMPRSGMMPAEEEEQS